MTQYLPANLLALFTARPPIPFKPPPDGLKKRKRSHGYSGMSDFISNFEMAPPPPATRGETRKEKEERRRQERAAVCEMDLEKKLAAWDPHSDPNASGDPFRTLFVGRINYDTTESKLRRELEAYGPVRKVHMVENYVKRRPRGYAFVEYDDERDMQSAYKHADGMKIDGRRIVVDVERGRTVKSWRPRRLGGGLGGTRRGGSEENIRHSGRVDQWESRDRDRDRDRDREERRERRRSRSPRERKDRDRRRDRDEKERVDRDRSERDRGERDRGERDRGERDRGERDRGDRNRGDRDDRDRERRRERKEKGERSERHHRDDRGEPEGREHSAVNENGIEPQDM